LYDDLSTNLNLDAVFSSLRSSNHYICEKSLSLSIFEIFSFFEFLCDYPSIRMRTALYVKFHLILFSYNQKALYSLFASQEFVVGNQEHIVIVIMMIIHLLSCNNLLCKYVFILWIKKQKSNLWGAR
jgi:hypothetical protein